MKTPARGLLATLAFVFCVPGAAHAEPRAGRLMPAFSVSDLEGTRHTQRDLLGGWTVVCAMTDKDIGPALEAWWRRVETAVPRGTRMLTFTALDLFALIPTATILTEARLRAPRGSWRIVWFSRDGSFARDLGLPDTETPWVFVVDPEGRVAESVHADVSPQGVARVVAALQQHLP